jgi:serralysin
MPEFTFTAFAEADLLDGHVRRGESFTQPASATLSFTVSDNDHGLSGDFFDRALDYSGQTAMISGFGAEVGNGRQVYAENAFHLRDADGNRFLLVEIEQEGSSDNYYTYFGAVPEAGAELTVGRGFNVTGSASYAELGAGDLPPNITTIASGSDDFNLLVKALSAAGLVETVTGLTDVTVFAPTDAAFTQLAVDLGFTGDTSDEDAVFGAIVAALTDLGGGDPIPLLTDVLLYHVSAGAKTEAEITAAGSVDTLLGASFGADGTALIDNEPDIANPSIVIADIDGSNGTIQAIDRVLLPIDIPGNSVEPPEEPVLPTLTGLVAASGGVFDEDRSDFDLLLNAVQAAGLAGALDAEGADLTVFAPNDAAFVGLAQTLGYGGEDEAGSFGFIVDALTLFSGGGDPIPLLTDILLYHVAPGTLNADAVLGADAIPTLLGPSLGVDGATLVDADPDLANPGIIATNLEASNGIAHVLDGVLLPVDVLQSAGPNDVDFIIGDAGSERIVTGKDNDFVSGKGGNDLIKLGRGADVGLGGDGNDDVRGGKGEDIIDGGAGRDFLRGGRDNDILTGGDDADVFIFFRNGGSDVVTDFTQGEDLIQLASMGLDHFNQIEGAISGDENAVIDFGRLEITLNGVAASSLTEDDFIFT